MKVILLLLLTLATSSFAFTVTSVEKETLAGVIQYFTVRHNDLTCLLDFNKSTQTVLFSICF